MYRNPQEFSDASEYSSSYEQSQRVDYAHPNYYTQGMPAAPSTVPSQEETSEQYSPTSSSHDYYDYPDAENNPYNPYDPSPTYGVYSVYPPVPAPQGEQHQEPVFYDEHTQAMSQEQRASTSQESANETTNESARRRKGLAGLGGLATTIGALLLKFKSVLLLLKFAPAIISAAISIGIYALFLGWPFAVGLVALLFLHEMGHALVMKLKGIPVGGLIFVPMLGAAVTMRQMPQNARDEAEVGIAGPIAGALAASACLAIAQEMPYLMARGMFLNMPAWFYGIWAPLAYFGFFINLFNLIPVMPFDGGRVLGAIDRRIWYLGFAALLGYQIWLWLHGNFSIWLLFFVVIAATQLWTGNKAVNAARGENYYNVSTGTRITLGLVYFGLAAVLVFGMTISHGLLAGLMQ